MKTTLCTGALALMLCLSVTVLAQPVVDGSADDPLYGPPIAVQNTQTNFGDSDLGQPDVANGSEIDQLFATIYDGTLYLVLAGNMQSNGNKLEIFFDTRAGGQNQLLYENPGAENVGIRRMSADTPANENGLKFTSGFEADFWVSVAVFGDPTEIFVDYAEIYVDEMNPGVKYFVGGGQTVCATDGGVLTGGDDGAPVMRATADNRNTLGVDGGVGVSDGSGVMTGVELAIDLADIGAPAGPFTATIFINGQQHDFISNQFIEGIFGIPAENIGEPRDADLGTTGHTPVTIPAVTDPVGACCLNDTCSLTTLTDCTTSGGTYLGDNVSCDGNPCNTIPAGACCFDDVPAGRCEVMEETDCLNEGGIYQGDDTTCEGCPCLLPRTGACCFGEVCETLDEVTCVNDGGEYVGDFTSCDDAPCAMGACCIGIECQDVRQFECDDLEGDWQGEGTQCADDPCSGPTIPTPHIAGDFQGWNPGSDPMTESAPGVFELEFTLDPDTRYEYKITDGTWDNSLPGSNSWVYTDATGVVNFVYDSNFFNDGWFPQRDRLGQSVDPGTWTAAGSFQSEVGGTDWNNADPATAMTPTGDPGVYVFTDGGIPAGDYEWKAVVTGSWDAISSDTRSINTGNMAFTVGSELDTVSLYVDAFNGRVKVEVEPGGPVLCQGDMDCDGDIDFDDIAPFVFAIGNQSGWEAIYPDCPWLNGDTDEDGDVDFDDIAPFVALIGTEC